MHGRRHGSHGHSRALTRSRALRRPVSRLTHLSRTRYPRRPRILREYVMGSTTELNAADGHRLSAYVAEPGQKPRGGMVIVQEIFGITRHIRAVADQYAAAGFLAV